MAHCLSPMMPEEEILGELRARLYDLGEARAYAPRSSTLEMYQLSLYGGTGLRITDIIVALLRNQLHATKESPRLREHWTAYRDKLLEALRVPWSGCARNTGSKKCLGGSSGCEVCRYSILSIASQLNTLALGFAGTTFASEGTDREVQGQKNESCSPNNRSSKPDLEAVQKELALTKSKLLEAEENSRCLEKVQELTQKEQQILKIELEDAKKELQTLNTELEDAKKELQTLNTELENAKTEASDIQKNREQYMTAYRNMTETINKCIKVLISDKGNSKARKDIILAVSLEHYDALDKDVTFRLETLSKQHPPDEDTKQRKALEQEALEHQHGRVKTLMKMDKHKEAEETAKSVLDNRRKNLGKDSEKTQDIFKDYCVILEKGVRLEAVEWEYLQVWFDDSLKDDKFRDGAGISLAELSQRRDQIDESALWYRKVAIRRLARLDVKGAANAALKMVATLMSFHLSSESVDTLRKIWEKADINLSDDVLSCGQELGQFFVSIGKYKEAKDVLLAVWKALQKCSGDEYIDRRIMTALALVSTIGQLPDDDGGDLDELYKSIADLAKVKGDKKVSLQHQYQLGCVQLSRMNTKEAETTLKAAWEEAKAAAPEGLGANNILTIQIGWSYGQALLSQPDRDADAKEVFKVLCKAALVQKRDDSRTLAQTVANLTIGRSYSELLLADAEACKDEERQLATYKLARDTLRNVWDEASLRVVKILEDRNLDALKDLLWIGDSYGECLTYLSAPTKAIAVLTEVLNLRKKWTTDTSEIETTSELLKEAVVAKSNLKQVDSPKKTMDKPVANDPGKVGQKSGGDAPHLSPSGPNKERAKSPARPAQPKPKPPKARKGRVGLLRYFAGI
ncbi:hypothetical protein V496_06054 [Pseudogymnoascus sp. VKM F-4515 (FW-2607)]|nr:hypothetical protein V496_06054 [Pseudogymnoascus sp. VKM F-4515 (FW-2607)]